ncbi:hypothetical protein FF100_34760 [Methylobacterium terricola]|uniref:Uncharacterized protein n=1 Tax=Methylobacterium terricola TaxID=2583531 RepID=A0A5C4L7U0_9HYPH|nr:hypothetical protein [Methylobacterium terricola]TNC06260.1 hypothetical protein FF100_34760 [Methylobacterium terricola]
MAEKFWGGIFEYAATVPVFCITSPLLVAVATTEIVAGNKAGHKVADGIGIALKHTGVGIVLENIVTGTVKFGDEHNKLINDTVVGTVVGTLVVKVLGG